MKADIATQGSSAFGLTSSQVAVNGGRGIRGNSAATVRTTFSGSIRTNGANAHGINVALTGGSGGHGDGTGDAGNGGAGGNGGAAIISGDGPGSVVELQTLGSGAAGINAKLVAGNGANGDSSWCCNPGRGGRGGDGGAIILGADAKIGTEGNSAPGIQLVSQGGIGGNAGSPGFGGEGKTGGPGGGGGDIDISGKFEITTLGTLSDGIQAYSLGGRGGKGSSGGFFRPGTGGAGGDTGKSGDITIITNGGSIETKGVESHGVFAQSIAGRAGTGSSGGVRLVNFGSNGGSAGAGGRISISNSARITTGSLQSAGIYAHSIGGGGGSGGDGFGIFYGKGGSGSIGGKGGPVSVYNSGEIATTGTDAIGIYAQSIGGTGGDGGIGAGIGGLGGKGSHASDGGPVAIRNTGQIRAGIVPQFGAEPNKYEDPTCGKFGCSHGILAQSLGGGGGNGGTSVGWLSIGGDSGGGGNGSAVSVDTLGNVATYRNKSSAILAQSVGGGGGTGGGSVGVGLGVAVAIGGSGGGGGKGAAVEVHTKDGALTTAGHDSDAIAARSVGGGGGTGGFAVALAVNPFGPAASIGIGARGGKGGDGGVVLVEAESGSIATGGEDSRGIFAQSIGGGGGDGGFSVSLSGAAEYGSVALSVGGKGNVGGHGSSVAVSSAATIGTTGKASSGIVAQSVGKGGGNGGFTLAGTASFGTGVGIALGVGGSGGGGGNGGEVRVSNTGAVSTTGKISPGVVAQSLGGGGGNGGLTIAGTFIPAGGAGAALSVGGSGGSGGKSSAVVVDNRSSILTAGDQSIGILAQSAGGGGGNGSLSLAGSVVGKKALSASVAIGGNGSGGGDGGAVSVMNSGGITTGNSNDKGDVVTDLNNAHAIVAQSVGGGGGNGGHAHALSLGIANPEKAVNMAIAVGGSGGVGGIGSAVDVRNAGSIVTYSSQASAIFAQSVGGGGGNGGSGNAYTVELGASEASATLSAAFAVGGGGGSGNKGGSVVVANSASVATYGTGSHGIFASSVGGGGGTAGSAKTFAYNVQCLKGGKPCDQKGSGLDIKAEVRIGGEGGKGNDGGEVSITNSGNIFTDGAGAIGLHAYSIGGGGGDGGDASGVALPVSGKFLPVPEGVPFTRFSGREKPYKKLTIGVGGNQGASGNGGNVTISHTSGNITTLGANAAAVSAQSVGGGGGKGGTASVGLVGGIAVGGAGGAAGNGGKVSVSVQDADIQTGEPELLRLSSGEGDTPPSVDAAYGIFAQSVGGGGGIAGNACFFGDCAGHLDGKFPPLANVTIGVGLSFLRSGGNGGDGGDVAVVSNSQITTYADNAVAIFAQSVGGGGGVAGNAGLTPLQDPKSALLGSVGGNGVGRTVEVDFAGKIQTFGNGATGIFAQSAGGKKLTAAAAGSAGLALASTGQDVSVNVDGSVRVNGNDASGIIVQSVKLDEADKEVGAGNATVTVAEGSYVQGGYGGHVQSGAGVEFLGAATSKLINRGTITSLGQFALTQSGVNGDVAIDNFGVIDGSVRLDAAAPFLRNKALGTFITGDEVRLGKDGSGLLTNDGILILKGSGAIGVTTVRGSVVQGPGGSLVFDHDADPVAPDLEADRLVIDGTAAFPTKLAGKVDVNLRDGATAESAKGSVSIIQSGTPFESSELSVVPSAVAQYSLTKDKSEVILNYDIDFDNPNALSGLKYNQAAIASHVDDLHGIGGVATELLLLTEAEDPAAYGNALDLLSPAPYGTTGTAMLDTSLDLAEALTQCDATKPGGGAVPTDCIWGDFGARRLDRRSTEDASGYDLDVNGISLGGQKAFADGWAFGYGVGVESTSGSATGGEWESSGEQYKLGFTVRRGFGNTLVGGSIMGGFGSTDVARMVPGGAWSSGEQDAKFFGASIGFAHTLERGDWSIVPRVDLTATHVSTDSVAETGAGAASLTVKASDEMYYVLKPEIQVSRRIAVDEHLTVEPSVTVGLRQHLSDPSRDVTARFASTGPAGATFAVKNQIDASALDLGLGVDVLAANGSTLNFYAGTLLSENTTDFRAGVRLDFNF